MIRLAAVYLKQPGEKFAPYGFLKIEVDQGLGRPGSGEGTCLSP